MKPFALCLLVAVLAACGNKSSDSHALNSQPIQIKSVTIGNLIKGDLDGTSEITAEQQRRYVRFKFESNFVSQGEWIVRNCRAKDDCSANSVLTLTIEKGVDAQSASGLDEIRLTRAGSSENDSQKITLILPRNHYLQFAPLIRVDFRAREQRVSVYLEKNGGGHVITTDAPALQPVYSTPEMNQYPWNLPARPGVVELEGRGVQVRFLPDLSYVSSHASWSMSDIEKKLDARLAILLKSTKLPRLIELSDNTAPFSVSEYSAGDVWTLGWRTPLTELEAHIARANGYAQWLKENAITLELGTMPSADLFDVGATPDERANFNNALSFYLSVLQSGPELKKMRVRLALGPSAETGPDLELISHRECVLNFGTVLLRSMVKESFVPALVDFTRVVESANALRQRLVPFQEAGYEAVWIQLKRIYSGSLFTSDAHYMRAALDARTLLASVVDLRKRRPEIKVLEINYDHLEMIVHSQKWAKIEGNQLTLRMPRFNLSATEAESQMAQLVELIKKL